ncbi:FXYD domain-containing ion transport regulator 7-like [Crotalus tigris]|uniref:FXYD domain-containing ion transport regulator 7-like n=1 Tax=Crotalus tigris TaxID=88082 RepID=UPI00192FA351|nr:FXYD domain-containing ion transport regulator 7-like [Crotalus tigris]
MITPAPHQETSQPVDPFSYDYDTLRLVGMILASIMFVLGILIALNCQIPWRQAKVPLQLAACRHRPEDVLLPSGRQ